MSKNRTPAGHPTAAARKEYGYKDTGAFPIFDRESAQAALDLIGHADSTAEKTWIKSQAVKLGVHPQGA